MAQYSIETCWLLGLLWSNYLTRRFGGFVALGNGSFFLEAI